MKSIKGVKAVRKRWLRERYISKDFIQYRYNLVSKKEGSYIFKWVIFLNVYLHWIALERGSQVILLRSNIVKATGSYFSHPVWDTGRAEVKLAFFFISFSHLHMGLLLTSDTSGSSPPCLAFPKQYLKPHSRSRVSTTHFVLCYNSKDLMHCISAPGTWYSIGNSVQWLKGTREFQGWSIRDQREGRDVINICSLEGLIVLILNLSLVVTSDLILQ